MEDIILISGNLNNSVDYGYCLIILYLHQECFPQDQDMVHSTFGKPDVSNQIHKLTSNKSKLNGETENCTSKIFLHFVEYIEESVRSPYARAAEQ